MLQVTENTEDIDTNNRAHALALRLGAQLVDVGALWDKDVVRLAYENGVLQACTIGLRGELMTVSADFLKGSMVRRQQQARGQSLIKAVQGRQRRPLTILDTTAGMATDTMVMATMGHRVTAIEQSQVVYELVDDGLQRLASAGLCTLPELVWAEAVDWLTNNCQQRFDVIYLDPMFENQGKRALPKKNMQLLRRLSADLPSGVGAADNAELLALARARARLRVVVKNPSVGGWSGATPDYSIKGQRVRFDIYHV